MAIRTFLALDLDAAIRDRLVEAVAEMPQAGAKLRWVARENLHVTVKFLGDVAEPGAAGVCEAVASAARAVRPFDFSVCGLRCVPPGGKVRMVWAEVDEPAGRMAAMFERLESALAELGFARERRGFHPHVTLGRVSFTRAAADLRAAAERWAQSDFGSVSASEIVVYQSDLAPRGPIYTALARVALAGQ